jgi:quercetin dioxygenase-like cupin family protein
MSTTTALRSEKEPTTGPCPTEILRGDLLGQKHKVAETLVTVVACPPSTVSTWRIHPGGQELVFGLQGKLLLEIDRQAAKSIGVGETSVVPAVVAHTVRNKTAGGSRNPSRLSSERQD